MDKCFSFKHFQHFYKLTSISSSESYSYLRCPFMAMISFCFFFIKSALYTWFIWNIKKRMIKINHSLSHGKHFISKNCQMLWLASLDSLHLCPKLNSTRARMTCHHVNKVILWTACFNTILAVKNRHYSKMQVGSTNTIIWLTIEQRVPEKPKTN